MLPVPTTTKTSSTWLASNAQSPQAYPPVWHMLSVDQIFDRLKSEPVKGLMTGEASRRLAQHGPNTLTRSRQRSILSIFISQFLSIIVALLFAAMAIAFAMGDRIEAVAILVVIVIIAGCSFLPVAVVEIVKSIQRFSIRTKGIANV